MPANFHICEPERIAAYIEGDLDAAGRLSLEEHIHTCSRCTSELQEQRVFMCELDSALADPFEIDVPANFAQVVAVRAESDMRGLRNRKEHARAFRFCIVLALAAVALLGATSRNTVIASARSIARMIVGIAELLGKAIYDAAAGIGVILRVLSGGFIADSRLAGLTALVFVTLAIGLLFLLISRYHRARFVE
ncbi:MAG TPA: zf-HC2 domain-containing protein [Pyrinomonadaceae bacterium]|nr:zf-HC2 domain-containing protein [Pyrinomonadaceae bacterium]